MSMRRGACPTFSAPMQTGDGLLARLHPVGPLSIGAFVGLCRAADVHGNGIVEVTQRGSLQIRGLLAKTLPDFTAAVQALDFDAPEGVVVQAPPLSSESLHLAAAVRARVQPLAAALAPKTTVIVDLGDGLSLDDLTADVRLRAAGPLLRVEVGGEWIGAIERHDAPDAVFDLLGVLAAAGPAVRAATLSEMPFRAALRRTLREGAPSGEARTTDPVGPCERGFGIALPFGATEARLLMTLAEASGAWQVWPAPGRALVFEGAAPGFGAVAAGLGLVIDPADPRRRVHACTGAPRCSSGLQPVRDLARALPSIDGVLHLSGCAKGCARPAPSPVTLVGDERGYGVVWDGRAGDPPAAWLAAGDALTKLADLLEKRRRGPAWQAAGLGAGRG